MDQTIETKKCNIFGVDEHREPDDLIKKALDASLKMLDLFKFIEIINFDLDPPIKEEMALLPHKSAIDSSKWLIMEPFDIKMAMLRLNTKNADKIKRYYVKMEELLRVYAQYTTLFMKREQEMMSIKMKNMQLMIEEMRIDRQRNREQMERQENMIKDMGSSNIDLSDQNNELLERVDQVLHKVDVVQNKLNISVEDRAPPPDKDPRKERFILLKRNNELFPYYTIRAQHINAERALKRQKTIFSEIIFLLDLECHPNTKTFYVRIKETLQSKGVVFNFCSISIKDSKITEQQLIEEMMTINDLKRDV